MLFVETTNFTVRRYDEMYTFDHGWNTLKMLGRRSLIFLNDKIIGHWVKE